MARTRYALGGFGPIFAALGLFSVVLSQAPSRAVAADPAAEVEARLAAGEFGPAIAAAGAINDRAQRDKLLGGIAAAQAANGAGRAALDTASDIASDLERKAALGSLAASQSGGKQRGARGGGGFADFDSLIELITSTIKPDSWDDVGGPGAIDQFAGGVYVDSAGLLRKLPTTVSTSLAAIHRSAADASHTGNPRQSAVLRKVSLTRLEREVQLMHAQGRPPTEAMQTLAGLKRIKYILVYPNSGDIVLAGPAGDWRRDAEGRYVDVEKSAPVLNLDDLVVTLRNAHDGGGKFVCSIDPRKDNLAAAKLVNEKWSKQPLRSGAQREKWLGEVRDAIGRQDIRVEGIDPRTRAGRILVEADYRMKLVALGLEEGTLGLTSYLASIELGKDGNPPPMNLLRLWFVLNYSSLTATEGRDAFELHGPGAKVLSENELLTERGERVPTGASDELATQFADSFTRQFDKLSVKYPIYAELRNVFDLALVSAVMRSHDLPGQVGWHMTHFGPGGEYALELGPAPTEVESVINHRVLGGKHVVAVISGGVRVDPHELAARESVKADTYGLMAGERRTSTPKELPRRAWWWD
jgi:Protein of unknown function (DUF1598)